MKGLPSPDPFHDFDLLIMNQDMFLDDDLLTYIAIMNHYTRTDDAEID